MTDISQPPATKNALSKPAKLVRLLKSVLDPRAYLHAFKMVNYYNYTHVAPLREIKIGSGAALSPEGIVCRWGPDPVFGRGLVGGVS